MKINGNYSLQMNPGTWYSRYSALICTTCNMQGPLATRTRWKIFCKSGGLKKGLFGSSSTSQNPWVSHGIAITSYFSLEPHIRSQVHLSTMLKEKVGEISLSMVANTPECHSTVKQHWINSHSYLEQTTIILLVVVKWCTLSWTFSLTPRSSSHGMSIFHISRASHS